MFAVTVERLDVPDDVIGPATVRRHMGQPEGRFRWERWLMPLCTSCQKVLSERDPNGEKGVPLKGRPERWYNDHRVGEFA